MTKQIAVLALPGVLDSALAITLDILHTGSQQLKSAGKHVDLRVDLIAPAAKTVRTARGARIRIDGDFSIAQKPAAIVIPGIDLQCEQPVATEIERLVQRKDVGLSATWLQRCHRKRVIIAAGCTATFILAQSGLLDGRQATTTWWLSTLFRERFPQADLRQDRVLTYDRKIACAGAAMAHIDLGIFMLNLLAPPTVVQRVTRLLVLDEHASQASYVDYNCMVHQSPLVSRAERWVNQHLADPIGIQQLAKALAVSPRTLARRFDESIGKTPIQFIQHLRIQRALHLLKVSELSFEEIAHQVGYANSTGLRRIIQRETGRLPSHFRHVR